MTKILFLCHGNICRSPMAEFVMKDMVKTAGLEREFGIAIRCHQHRGDRQSDLSPDHNKLAKHGIGCAGKIARQMCRADYERFDCLIGVDRGNLRNMQRICGGDFTDKMHLLMDFIDHPGEVDDP